MYVAVLAISSFGTLFLKLYFNTFLPVKSLIAIILVVQELSVGLGGGH